MHICSACSCSKCVVQICAQEDVLLQHVSGEQLVFNAVVEGVLQLLQVLETKSELSSLKLRIQRLLFDAVVEGVLQLLQVRCSPHYRALQLILVAQMAE